MIAERARLRRASIGTVADMEQTPLFWTTKNDSATDGHCRICDEYLPNRDTAFDHLEARTVAPDIREWRCKNVDEWTREAGQQ